MAADTAASHRAVEELVGHYQAKARAVGRLGVVIGASAGVLVGAVPLSPLRFAWPIPSSYGFATILGGLIVGVMIGYVIGEPARRCTSGWPSSPACSSSSSSGSPRTTRAWRSSYGAHCPATARQPRRVRLRSRQAGRAAAQAAAARRSRPASSRAARHRARPRRQQPVSSRSPSPLPPVAPPADVQLQQPAAVVAPAPPAPGPRRRLLPCPSSRFARRSRAPAAAAARASAKPVRTSRPQQRAVASDAGPAGRAEPGRGAAGLAAPPLSPPVSG